VNIVSGGNGQVLTAINGMITWTTIEEDGQQLFEFARNPCTTWRYYSVGGAVWVGMEKVMAI
jgi:hypothetical protein